MREVHREDIENRVASWSFAVASILVLIGIVGLMALTTYALISDTSVGNELRKDLINNVAGNFGVPAAALAAFVLVSVLWSRFPPKSSEGQLQLEIFGLRFTGPSGPISLWVVCFLAFVLAIWLLKLPRTMPNSNELGTGAKQELPVSESSR